MRETFRFMWPLALALALALCAPGARAADAGEKAPIAIESEAAQPALEAAEHSVRAFQNVLLETVRGGADFEQRLAALLPVVAERFNLATIARLSLGRTWRTLEDAEQEQFRAALHQLIAATYADRFSSDSGQSFEIRSVQAGRRGPVVRTLLVRQNGAPVMLDYHFRSGGIYNVVADGVSDLSLRRADYNSIIKQEGYQALLAHIAEQTRTLGVNDDTSVPAVREDEVSNRRTP